jgi:hypothetical protein
MESIFPLAFLPKSSKFLQKDLFFLLEFRTVCTVHLEGNKCVPARHHTSIN